jgi:uncharacterized protein with von Willebrand factor type A (vWA) domain
MTSGRLSANIMHFARMLRRAGLPVGPAEMLAAQQAITLIDLGSRAQVRTALRATMVHRHEHEDLFNHAFALFWRDPEAARAAAALQQLGGRTPPPERAPPGSRRLSEAMQQRREPQPMPPEEQHRIEATMRSPRRNARSASSPCRLMRAAPAAAAPIRRDRISTCARPSGKASARAGRFSTLPRPAK